MRRHDSAVRLGVTVAVLLAFLTSATDSSAQYFGRNKVPYRSFDFKVLKTEHFDVYFYTEEEEAVAQAARMAERWYARLSRVLGHELSSRQPLILYASHPHFEQTNAIPGEIEESTGGVTESLKRRIVLPLAGSLAETDHVIGHELVHAFQYDLTGRAQGTGAPAIQRLPLWFVEGMAEYLSIGPVDAHTAMWMRDAAYHDRLPTIAKLDDPHFFPYRFGHAFWAYVGQRWGDATVGELLRAASRNGDVPAAFSAMLGMNADSLSREWQRSLRMLAERVSRNDPDHEGRTLVKARGDVGRYNLAPALSPDGRQIMFLSERDFYSMELFLADAQTGRVIRKITRTAIDPHLQSLQFVGGSGAWSADGHRFAFSTIRDGHPVVTVIDVSSGHTLELVALPTLEEVLGLSWSPDGAAIAFSALTHGHTDLFTLDLGTSKLRQWTDDLYADLQPAWSPDGRSIAFATERYTSNLDSLEIGALRLARLDVPAGTLTALPAIAGAKHVNPQWSVDGRSIYAILDGGGISNLHRLDVASGRWQRLTSLSSGISGITAYSPAFSVARNADRLVFAGYDRGAFNLYAMDSLAARSGMPPLDLPAPGFAQLVADTLQQLVARPLPPPPPPDAPAGFMVAAHGDSVTVIRSPIAVDSTRSAERPEDRPRVATLLGNPHFGLADTIAFRRASYRPALSLDRVSQIELGVGTSGAGVAGSGGAALVWSDMLGDHNLGTYVAVSSDFGNFTNNFAAILDYENLKSRWNWGIEASQLPYVTRQFTVERVRLLNGDFQDLQRDLRLWQIERRLVGTLAYPFSRAERFEFSGGYQNLDYVAEVETQTFDSSGNLIDDTTSKLDLGFPRLNLGIVSAAWVHDQAFFGGTSPIAGSRWRLGVEPVFGDLHFAGVLGDYRHYLMPKRPFTLAVRGLHYGRYGSDGESSALTPLFLGYPNLVRGYDDASFNTEECIDGGFGPCPTFDQLFGSRMGVANAELRMPLLGVFGLLPTPGVPPIEAAAFFDAGAAWTAGDRARFLGGDRNTVTSHGLALRMNLFGFLIAEVDLVHPNDRPRKGWYWQFSFQPGF